MAKLIYASITSLDGYIQDDDGKFDWAAPDEELLAFINDLERPIGTYLYGRRMYETMASWETMEFLPDRQPLDWDFAQMWRAADKIVFSRTLKVASSARTKIERAFDADIIRRLKDAATTDLTVGGADLAAQAFRLGAVDECHLFLHPIVVGGGKTSLPTNVRLRLDLVEERRFTNGVVHLHYHVAG